MKAQTLFEMLDRKGKPVAGGFLICCPAHDDENPSLSISDGDSGLLWRCHAGCSQDAVLEAFKSRSINLLDGHRETKPVSQARNEYLYFDENENAHLKVVRLDSNGTKSFKQMRNENGKWVYGGAKKQIVPYRFHSWKDLATKVFLVEGEKCVEALESIGLVGTTTPGGSNSWKNCYASFFAGKDVYILPDNDEPGRKYAKNAFDSINGLANTVGILALPDLKAKEDVFDWIASGGSKEKLEELIERPVTHAGHCGPKPLLINRENKIAYPVEALGGVLSSMAQVLYESVQAPLALCAQSVIAAASLAVQNHRNVEIDGRIYPLSVFVITASESGERKTAVDKIVLNPVREHERRLYDRYEIDLKEYKKELVIYEKAKKSTSKKSYDFDLDPPEPPLYPYLLVEDPTYEGLVKLLKNGQPGVGLFSDEGGRIIGGHSMNSENQLKTISGLSELWDGKPVSRIRAGDESFKLYGRRLSVHLMAQPQVLKELTSNNLVANQGILARCLTAFPKSTVGTRKYKEFDIRNSSEVRDFNEKVYNILECPWELATGKRNELKPPSLKLSTEAKRIWIEFHDYVERNQGKRGEFANIRAFASKAAEHLLRIAGILTCFDNLDADEIGVEATINASKLVHYYLEENLLFNSESALDPELIDAQELLDWLQSHPIFYQSKVVQFGPNRLRKKSKVEPLLQILEDGGHIQRMPEGTEVEGKPRERVWKLADCSSF